MTKQKESVQIVKLTDFNFPPEVFIPLKSGKFIDTVISKKGGTMPATISVVVGEPGSGKTTMLVDKMTGIERYNPDKKCLYISSEMNPIDNRELAEELPQLMNLNTLYMADYENPKLALEQALDMGWDYVIMDSFMDVKDKIKDSQSKMNASTVETWLINLLVKHTKGQNELKKYTSFDVIQHITKGGEYAGSTKLKHNTTAMMFVRVDEVTGQRYLVYVKNRRGDTRKKLYMVLDKISGEINYDSKKYNELEKAIEIQKQMDSFQNENDQKLLELLQQSETSDKEIYSKVPLVKEFVEEDTVSDVLFTSETEEQIMREFEGESDDEIEVERIIQMGR
jgi:predicted ATP-dependent serine protease